MSKIFFVISLSVLAVITAACGGSSNDSAGKTIKSGSAGNNLTVTLSSTDGVLRDGKNEFTLTFADASGKPVDAGAVSVNFHMPAMGTMPVMNDAAQLTMTGTPGVYKGTVNLQMAGEWQTQITYEGAAGRGKANLPIVAQ
ncbi:MAG TPA: FixH family protein [Pyrinomonadaceae bacterium]|jgi:nitrogen fixation protein FixH